MKKIDVEQIWSTIDETAKKHFSDFEYNKFKNMFEQIGERFLTAPASARTSYHCCFPGGLAFYTLKVFNFIIKLSSVYELNVPVKSLIKVAIFANLGKIGGINNDLLIVNESDWHKRNGMLYSYNENLSYMHYAVRSLQILQHFDIKLTEQEFTAIYYLKEQEDSDNPAIPYQSNDLGFILFTANILAAKSCSKSN